MSHTWRELIEALERRIIDWGDSAVEKINPDHMHGLRINAWFSAIGSLAGSWTTVEMPLDTTNWMMVKAMPKRRPFPLAFGQKIKFFRQGHEELPVLAKLRDAANALADRAVALSPHRNTVIHGVPVGDIRKKGAVPIYRHHVPRGAESHMLFSDRTSYSVDDIVALWRASNDLSRALMAHENDVAEALFPGQNIQPAFPR